MRRRVPVYQVGSYVAVAGSAVGEVAGDYCVVYAVVGGHFFYAFWVYRFVFVVAGRWVYSPDGVLVLGVCALW